MMMPRWLFLWLSVLSGPLALAQAPYDLPFLPNLVPDGDPQDWGADGFRVEALVTCAGEPTEPEDFDATFRVAWNQEGLGILASVRDQAAHEAASDGELSRGDCFHVILGVPGAEPGWYEFIHASGADPRHPHARHQFFDHRLGALVESGAELTVRTAVRHTPGLSTTEVLLPWSNLGMSPVEGWEGMLQLLARDVDGPVRRLLAWYPSRDTARRPELAHRIRLAGRASPPVRQAASLRISPLGRLEAQLVSRDLPAGTAVEILARGFSEPVAWGRLAGRDGPISGCWALPWPADETAPLDFLLRIGGGEIQPLPDPGLALQRTRLLMELEARPERAVFDGEEFPACDLADPRRAGHLLGPYRPQTRYYDAGGRRVERPGGPGRYGAVVEIVPEVGPLLRRHLTLYRAPFELQPWRSGLSGLRPELDSAWRFDPATVSRHQGATDWLLQGVMYQAMRDQPTMAAWLAGLGELSPDGGEVSSAENAVSLDRQWWVDFKRRQRGVARSARPIVDRPQRLTGQSAPILRSGTPAEAGLQPEVVTEVSETVRAWVGESGVSCTVTLARRGVVFFEEAFPAGPGEISLSTPTWMASITKLLSASLGWMLLDQELWELSAPVDRYLPELSGRPANPPLTVHHLYTHTSGLWDHWGDEMPDLEERLATGLPLLEVGRRFEYNGTGCAVAGKIVEALSGESVPGFYQRHLLEPLGLEHTHVTGTYGDASSTSGDLAIFAQMLLQGGSYGEWRFFSPGTLERVLPADLAGLGVPGQFWGVGVAPVSGPGLGPRTYGHGAASGAILAIDPDRQLVIVMARPEPGRGYKEWRDRFLAAITGRLVD